ncbi:hypothetical protein, partial [Leucobacter sp. 7(1)]|uniref:hypothetical protein n=1 Tax=Leucobacter sp. 7(1) TaxID=1255613 RepID=UPI00112009E0
MDIPELVKFLSWRVAVAAQHDPGLASFLGPRNPRMRAAHDSRAVPEHRAPLRTQSGTLYKPEMRETAVSTGGRKEERGKRKEERGKRKEE